MWKLTIIVAIFAISAWSQGALVSVKPPLAVPRWDKGVIEGGTYKNTSVGIELTPASQLTFATPELKGKPGAVNSFVTISAWGSLKPTRIESTTFSAIALASYPEGQRSTDACMRKVVHANQNDGFNPIKGSSEGELGGVAFTRTDFLKKGPAYETILVKACDTQALIFVFVGSSQDAVNKIIGATELKLDLSRSACAP